MVFSIVMGVGMFLAVFHADTDTYHSTSYRSDQIKTQDEENLAKLRELSASYVADDIRACRGRVDLTPYIGDREYATYMIVCRKTDSEKVVEAAMFSPVPGLILLAIGLIAAWVRRGFNKPSEEIG